MPHEKPSNQLLFKVRTPRKIFRLLSFSSKAQKNWESLEAACRILCSLPSSALHPAMLHGKTHTITMRSNKQETKRKINSMPTENHLPQMLRDPFMTVPGKDLFYSNTRTRMRRAKHQQLSKPGFNRSDAKIQRDGGKTTGKKR